ncbi:MAG: prephenate dehydrogenase/arogenate dehydrogenase family protein [Pseudomonadales bacterium]
MQLVVIGTGLIGGSFALAARRHGLFDEFVGIEPDAQRGAEALALGVVDRLCDDVPRTADAVVIASPGETIGAWVARLAGHRAVVFDTGSVKAPVIAAVRAHCGALPPRFVPAHPIAGKERSGPAAADAELFEGQQVILTPAPETDPDACARVEAWWRALGSTVIRLDAAQHDTIYAVTSHLPHLLAFAYLQQVDGLHLQHAGGGFRDFSRIGAADPDMWAPIFELNRGALLAALERFETDLAELRRLIEAGDTAGIKSYLMRSRARRRELE